MKGSIKSSRFWKRLLSVVMTIVMLVTILPTAAFAALWDNTPSQNEAILKQLKAFWGDEKTAQEAMELLRQYGLIDEDGNVLTDWSGTITIQEESRSLTIGEARALSGGEVTVNGHPCSVTELKEALDRLEALGLLVDNVPVADWQLQVDGQPVSPAHLAEVLDSWTAPENPEQPQQPEQPEEPEQPTEPEPETPEQPQGGGAGSPEQAGGILASIGRFFGVGDSAVPPAAPVVTVLGTPVDPDELLEAIAFLEQYELLTGAGCVDEWTLTLPGGERETDVSELLSMLESGDYDPDMVIAVDGTPVTMADFATMMEIQKEIQRIRDTYLQDNVELTPEQAGNLYELYQQLQANGIKLYNVRGADNLTAENFLSGEDQTQRVTVPESVTVANGGSAALTLTLDHAVPTGKTVTLSYRVAEGSASGTVTGGVATEDPGVYNLTFAAGESTKEITVASSSDERWNGKRAFVVEFFDVDGALFGNEVRADSTVVYVTNDYTYADLLNKPIRVPDSSPDDNFYVQVKGQKHEGTFDPEWKRFVFRDDENNYEVTVGSSTYRGTYINYRVQPPETFVHYDYTNPFSDDLLALVADGVVNGLDFRPSYLDKMVRVRTANLNIKIKVNAHTVIDYALKFPDDYSPSGPGIDAVGDSLFVREGAQPFVPLEKTDTQYIWQIDATHTLVKYNDSVGYVTLYLPTAPNPTYSPKDTKNPSVEEIKAPAGPYYYGQTVPITVQFSEPVYGDGLKLTANGEELPAVDTGSSSFGYRQTFLYKVPVTGDTQLLVSKITGIKDLSDKTNTYTPAGGTEEILPEQSIEAANFLAAINTPVPSAAVVDLKYSKDEVTGDEKTTATVEMTLDLPENKNLRQLLSGSYHDGTNYNSAKLAASMDGGQTLIPLVLDNGDDPNTMTATAEIDAAKLVGFEGDAKTFVMEFYQISVDKEDNSITPGDLIFGRYAAFSVNKPVLLEAEDITVTKPTGWPQEGASVYVNDPPEPAALKWNAEVGAGDYTWTQYSWYSDKPEVADIDANGQVTLYGSGTANFYVKALNGGLYGDPEGTEDDDLTYAKRVGSITVQEGAMPYLRIPEANSSIRSGDPFTLRWASNLVQKNGEFADNAYTTFEIKVYKGTDATGEPVQTHTVTYDPNNTSATFPGTDTPMWVESTDEDGSKTWTPNQSFVIQGLTDTDPAGYTVTITAKANEKVPGYDGTGHADGVFTASTHVVVISKPVSVHLERPARMFVTNGEGTLTIPYTLTNFDAAESGGAGADFKLTVTDNATGQVVTSLEKPDSVTGGSFTIDLGVEIEDGFRTIYDVSLQAKNTAEPDWSRDSFTLYIYDKNALDILVQPVKRGEITTVGVSGDTITMSNEDWIASLPQEEILALERDIDLQAAISINYGDHAWGEASDRIRWAVDNSGIAAVNYPQGAYYENIEGLPYTSYAPATEFLLSGKNDGKTVVQAIHDLAGDALSSSVEVTVETLKDKLYLFQFYPARGGLTATYTNGDGKIKTASGDSQGRFAIYEASGIASDVYVKGEIDKDIYLGTVYHSRLVSQEKDAVSLELYPLNSLTLRKAATLPVYLLDEEGDPFNGNVTVRAGVYRNGTYCAEAKFGSTVDNVKLDGGIDQTIQFTNGKATFYYDLTQFNTNGGADPVTAADDIQFVLELRPGGGTTYYPVLFTASGTTNEADAIRMAERIVALEKVPEGQANQPFVARQAAYFSGGESGPAVDVRNQNGKLGPSSDYPDLLLSTTVLWWGEEIDAQTDAKRSIQYVDSVGITLQGQQVDNVSYPFCSMPVTHSTVHLDQSQLSHLGLKDLSIRTITLQYIDGAGFTAKQEKMRWQLLNALNMDKASESGELVDAMDALLDIMETEGGVSGIGSGFLNLGLQLATSASIDSDFLTLQLAPTQDPTVFRGLVYVGAGFGTDGVSGADGPGNLIETMEVEDESSYDLNYMPGLSDVISVIGDGLVGYGQAASDEVTQAKNARQQLLNSGQRTPVTPGANGQPSTGTGNNKKGQTGANMALSGYFETEVYYDFNAGEWKMQLVTGGFQAGGSFGYEWSSNFQVGPVPLFLEIGIGMSATVDFNAAVNNVEDLNDYLTQLQLQAYIEAFGGFGFDYAVVALKLGLFGELSLTAQLRWLNAAREEIGEQFGHKVDLAGEVGVKAEVTVLFISYSAVLWSTDFNWNLDTSGNWDSIEDYWLEVGAGKSGAGSIIVPEGANLLAYDAATGTAILSAQQDAALVDRDYLSQYGRSYNSAGPGESIGLLNSIGDFFTGHTPSNVVETIESAYSYASPVITDDGEWLFYLDDMEDSTDATVVRVSAAQKNDSGGYSVESQAALDDDGYGDSGLKAVGDSTNPVAVWSRVMEKPAITEPGQAITPDVQAAMMSSSDIMVAVRDGQGWDIQNLTATTQEDQETSNGLADLSPVVAASGENILVAWRQVASSDAVDLTNFDARDYIYFRYSSDYGKTWTDAQPIYNGTSGAVKGIEAAMLPDGTAAVAFTLQTGTHDSGSGEYSQEIAYAIVGQPETGEAETLADGTSAEYQVLRYVQMTDDENLDENPQLAAVKLDETNKVFILGWHSLSAEGGSDIRLAAVDTKGNRITGFVDSLSNLIQNTGVAVSANFQFVQNADSLEELSILWSETVASEEGMEENEPSRDALSALRFRVEDEQGKHKISVTSAQRLVEMEAYTTIDNFNAYVDDGDIYSVLQGTFYDYSNPEAIAVGNTTVQVAADVTNIYTAKGGYTESLRVDSIIPDYPNIKSGMPIPVQVGVTNLGTQPMSSITVKIGEESKAFEAGKDGFVAIAPGETRTLTVFYTVKANEKGQIIDPEYMVTGTIGDSNVSSEAKTLVLNIPDLGIADSKILVGAEDGDRILQFTLYNESDAKLSGSGNTVQFRFYSDPECTQPIDNGYFEEETLLDLFANGEEPLKTIRDEGLAEIDEGIYTLRYRFDLEEYIQQTEEDSTKPFADEKGEVRDGGITLYAKAWVQMDGGEMVEFNSGNNTASVTVESLLKQSGEKVTVESQLSQNATGGSVVNVTLRNNSIVNSDSGNLIVSLYDAQGNKVAVQQSYQSSESDLVKLNPEEIGTSQFAFAQSGVRAEVTYGDVVLASNNAGVTSLTFSEIPVTLEDFTRQADGTYTASAEVSQLGSTLVNVVTESVKAKVTINDQPMELGGETIDLSRGENVLQVVVTSEDASRTTTYILTVQNSYPSSGGGGGGSSNISHTIDVLEDTEHGTVTVSPEKAKSGQTVTITTKPDEGYQVGKITVTDKNGDTVKITNKGDGVYTFTMPDSAVSVDVTFVPEGQWTNPFVDVAEGTWYYDAVKYVNENSLMAGTSATTFAPDLTTTRGMIVTILYRLEGSPDIEDEIWGYPFKDVDANAWYATAVYWARMNGIVAGYSDELFGPNDTITREQMATILYRYAQYKGYDTTAKADLSQYTDAAQVGSWATDAIRWANAEGLVSGTSSTTLSPQGSATRSQAATILMRFCENIAK